MRSDEQGRRAQKSSCPVLWSRQAPTQGLLGAEVPAASHWAVLLRAPQPRQCSSSASMVFSLCPVKPGPPAGHMDEGRRDSPGAPCSANSPSSLLPQVAPSLRAARQPPPSSPLPSRLAVPQHTVVLSPRPCKLYTALAPS